MMSDFFNEWLDLYCSGTGSGPAVRAVLLAARHTITVEWGASAAELGECLSRLVAGCRVPAFATEVTNALGRELRELRAERADAGRPDHSDAYYEAPKCELCGGTGLVTVPLAGCVWQGRIVCAKNTKRVLTGAVLCDLPDCARGRAAREREGKRDGPGRPTYSRYCARFGGLHLAEMLRQFEREVAAACRQRPIRGPEEAEFAALVARIKARAEAEDKGAA